MRLLDPGQRESVRLQLLPDRPGPMVGLHIIATGHGACFADRWPQPRAMLSVCGENYSLTGDPAALQPADLQQICGLLDAPPEFEALLDASFDDVPRWQRRVFQLRRAAAEPPVVTALVRRLEAADTHHVYGLSQDIDWISSTWGGPFSLCASGKGFGAFVDGQLASVAVPFYMGERYEDIGIVTEPEFRGAGLSAACTAAVVRDTAARGRIASWSTSPDNTASLRVAEKLGFELDREDVLYVIRTQVPEPAGE